MIRGTVLMVNFDNLNKQNLMSFIKENLTDSRKTQPG